MQIEQTIVVSKKTKVMKTCIFFVNLNNIQKAKADETIIFPSELFPVWKLQKSIGPWQMTNNVFG